MRLFLAVELTDAVRKHVTALRDAIAKDINARASLTRAENLHITLKFLGETNERRRGELIESLARVRADSPIQLAADRIECFPPRGPVRIVAAGFGGDIDAQAALYGAIEQRCQNLGFERETRAYRPHVTLVRARPTLAPEFRKVADSFVTHFPGPSFHVTEFSLVESRLRAEGSEYHTLERFKLIEAS
jgi:2'-5' RNA ligase